MKSEGQENIKHKKWKGIRACVGKPQAISAWQEGEAMCEGLEVKARWQRFFNVMLNEFGIILPKKIQ